MKKRMSKIVSILLVSALVVSTGSVVHAEDAGGTATEIVAEQAAGAQVLEPMDVSGEAKDISAKATVTGSIPLNKIVTGAETTADVGEIIYNNTSSFKKGGNYQYGYSQAVSLTKGTLIFSIYNDSASSTSATYGLYKDANLIQKVGSDSVSAGITRQTAFQVPSNGTYYMGVYSNMYSGNAAVGVRIAVQFLDGSDRTLTSGKQVAVGVKDAQTTYFKFKATKTGYIRAEGDSKAGSYSVALLNSKKKALSGDTSLRYSPVYGVKKGTTYYIRVKSSYNSSGGYVFKVTNTAIKEKSGAKKTKAVTIKRKATKKGTIQAGSSQADWYKIKKTNKNKIKITMKGATNNALKISVYKGNSKKALVSGKFYYYNQEVYVNGTNWPKGTYYIKIERVGKKSSGYYSLKWT